MFKLWAATLQYSDTCGDNFFVLASPVQQGPSRKPPTVYISGLQPFL